MGQILRHWRILTATLFSAVLVVGAFALAHSVESPPIARASMESALLQAIATRDSDDDGLPDWEEALYGADPHATDTFGLGMADSEAVARGLVVPKAIADIRVATSSPVALVDDSLPPPPAEGTMTAAFAENFFTLYVAAKQRNGGVDLSESDMAEIARDALKSLSATAAPDFKSKRDIVIFGSGSDALLEFAVRAEAVLLKNTVAASASEIVYLQDAVQNNNAEALAPVVSIAKAYRDSAAGLAALPVPAELAHDHLVLVNTLMRMSEITADFARVNIDPLATILALQQYPQTVLALGTAFINIGSVYTTAGVALAADEAGASFVNLIVDVANEQAAQKL